MTISRAYDLSSLEYLAAGCGSSTSDTTTTPTTTTSPTTSTFASRLPPYGSAARAFTATQAGTVTVRLVSAGDPSTIVGLGIGVPLGGISNCTLSTSVDTTAGITPQIAATVDAGSYCVAIYDLGALTSAVDFEITINYP